MGEDHAIVVAVVVAVVVVLFSACSGPGSATCESWTWIEDEGCLMDVCAEGVPSVNEISSECRDAGECWCCDANDCWFSGEILTE